MLTKTDEAVTYDGLEVIGPQPGKQTEFGATVADIAIYGGSAGSGKSYGLILEPTRHIHNPRFGAVIFRRKLTEIEKEGGLWDEAMLLYPGMGARVRGGSDLDFRFPGGAVVAFGHLQYDETVLDWHSAQIALMCFDELTTFTKKQFFYMLSRNRSVSGVKPYVRATCNPDADSWVADFISWWWDEETGYPISRAWWKKLPRKWRGVERSGVLRWMIKIDEDINWFDSEAEAMEWAAANNLPDDLLPKSVTFIAAKLDDNPALLKKDPGYKGNLYMLGRVDRERLLEGNWKIRASGGKMFKRNDFKIAEDYPRGDIMKDVRFWDFAGTEVKRSRSRANMAKMLETDPDWTVGTRGIITKDLKIYIIHSIRQRGTPGAIEELFKQITAEDGRNVAQWIEEEPGASGKFMVDHLKKLVIGYTVKAERPTGSKVTRAEAYQAYSESGNVFLVRGPWNSWYLDAHDAFPDPNVHDDPVDSGSGLFKKLTDKPPSTAEAMAGRRKKRR